MCATLYNEHREHRDALEGVDHKTLSRSCIFDVTIGQAYATLGLEASSATPDTARSRFRELIRSNHPDGKPAHEQVLANEKTLAIIDACTVLRTNGFLSSTACGRTGDVSRPERMSASGHEPADPFAWLDEFWCEYVRGNLATMGSPVFRVGLGAPVRSAPEMTERAA